MSKVRFIHTSDIHLGSLLHITGEMPAEIAMLAAEATYEAFHNICAAAVEYEVDFIVISGDLYDREARSIRAVDFFVQQCKMLAGHNIFVYVIAGNHDPIGEQPELFKMPENVTLIRSEQPETHTFRNAKGEETARIIGQSYRGREDSRSMHLEYSAPDAGLCNIALLHTQLEPFNNRYVPCSLSELKETRNIHYWALGHIHHRRIFDESIPVTAFSGIPQGRDSGEDGTGGCYLIDLDTSEKTEIKFIPTSPVEWIEAEIMVDEGEEARNINELEEKMYVKADEILKSVPSMNSGETYNKHFKGYVVLWSIKGKGDIHELLASQHNEVINLLKEKLQQRFCGAKPFLWTESIEINTGRKAPTNELTEGNPLFEEIEKAYNAFFVDKELKHGIISKMGQIMEQDADPENINEHKIQLDGDLFAEILEKSKEIIMEQLLEGRDN
ncbi:MAG: DNA repair exonuclease [Eubacteriales bacterium]|nr:DNA repair exonuclease [Eubacteriales bacterium]